jgi:hypothetical protein
LGCRLKRCPALPWLQAEPSFSPSFSTTICAKKASTQRYPRLDLSGERRYNNKALRATSRMVEAALASAEDALAVEDARSHQMIDRI